MRRVVVALLAGALFGAGLAIGGMLDTANVLAFLDVSGAWNPRLAFVLVAAIAVFLPAYRWSVRTHGEQVAARLPVRDPRLVVGATLFGVGWGLVGYCPGPGLVSMGAALLGVGTAPSLTFVGSMAVGMLLFEGLERARRALSEQRAGSDG